MKRKCFGGVEKEISELDHQHLSNIIWYELIINGRDSKEIDQRIILELNLRFNGMVLPYKPLPEFEFEIKKLISLSSRIDSNMFLTCKTSTSDGMLFHISYFGIVVGECFISDEAIKGWSL